MKRKITAAFTAFMLVITTMAANHVTVAAAPNDSSSIKSFSKVEDGKGVQKCSVNNTALSNGYLANDKVTIIVELKDDPLLDHYNNRQLSSFSADTTSFDEYAVTPEAEGITDDLLKQQTDVIQEIDSLKTATADSEVLYHYTSVMNGFALKTNYGALASIRRLPNVKTAYVAGYYEKIEPVMDSSTKTIGAVDTWDLDYKGQGTIVAVVDTGLDTGHTAFKVDPTLPKFQLDNIQNKIDVSVGLNSGIKDASKTYVSLKIPYAYDYADHDTQVTPSSESITSNGNEHGTHVAGTIASPDGDHNGVTGVAPEAQLMIFKVFSDVKGNTGAYTEDIVAALNDAVTLGADVINMSLGSSSGFSDEGEESESNVYKRIAASGITLAVSAGNSSSISSNNGLLGKSFSSNPDTAVVGSPSTYAASTSVASVINTHFHAATFQVEGKDYLYSESASGKQPFFTKLLTVSGGAIAYVPVPGTGTLPDYEGVDVNGKIALVQRGSISFNDKLLNAYNNGAIGIIVYNNQPGTINMAISDYEIPAISITKDDGLALVAASDKIVHVKEGVSEFPDKNGNKASDFSSWGVTPDLKLKPEIAAPGENIYSTVPFNKYHSMSGTSMAAPHIAGTFALVKQYLNTTNKFGILTEAQKGELANDLLMSTAIPTKDGNDTYYSPRKQGSGIVNVYNAVNTDAYLFIDDAKEANSRPRLHFGDDPAKTGVYTKSFYIRSVTGSAITYIPVVTTLTEKDNDGLLLESANDISANTNVTISVNNVVTPGAIVVEPNVVTKVTVTLQLDDTVKDYLNTSFKNGEFIDGFVTLKAQETNYDLNIPFLGFYGDWTQAPLLDSGSAYNLEAFQQSIHALYTANKTSTNYLGVNPFDKNAYALIGDYNPYYYQDYYNEFNPKTGLEKIAISPNGDGEFDRLYAAQISLLRNAKDFNFEIKDSNGVTILKDSAPYTRKSIYNSTSQAVRPVIINNDSWDGTDSNNQPLPNNSVVTFTVSGTLDFDAHTQNNQAASISFPITIDTEAPVLEKVVIQNNIIKITVKDNQFISAVMLFDKSNPSKPVGSTLLDAEEKGTSSTISINPANLGLTGKTAKDLSITIYDYAMNKKSYNLVKETTPVPTDPTYPTDPIPTPSSTPTPTVTATPTPTAIPTKSPIEQVKVTPSKSTLYVGKSRNISVSLPKLTEKDSVKVTYHSNKKSVATVSSTGKISAKKAGTATITTKVTINKKSKTFTTKVTVKKPYIAFTKKLPFVKSGKTYKYAAKVYGTKGTVTYSVSNKKFASINKKTGKLTAKKTGTVYVTAKVGKLTKKYKVVIYNKPLVAFTKKASFVKVGKTYKYTAKVYGTKGKVTYSVSNKKLASINKKTGKLTAKKTGTVYVTAKVGKLTKKHKVVIYNKPLIAFTKKASSLKVGKSYTYAAKVYGTKGKVTYSVSNKKLASINKKTGKLTAKKAGTVYVTAKVGKLTKKYKVTIKK